jgi:hypothetical protein
MSDLWTTSSVDMTMTSSESGAGMVNRPITYDPTLVWVPGVGWSLDLDLLAAGGGRYHQQIVMVGRDNTGNGKVYYA